MKILFPLLVGLLCSGMVVAQKTEFSVQLNASASYFSGSAADKTTLISVSDTGGDHYLGQNYGTKPGLGYGFGLQLQRVTAGRMLLGVQVTAEQLRSKLDVIGVESFSPTISEAEGDATTKLNAYNLQPYVGYRISTSFADFDLTLGSDVGFIYKTKFHGEATLDNGNTLEASNETDSEELDIRPRAGIAAYKGHFGLALSYAHGLTNYRGDWDGGNSELYSRVFRLGLLYRL